MINFVGWFVFPYNPGPFLAMLERLAKAGHPVPIVTVMDDPALADRIKQTSPKTFVIFRVGIDNPGPDTKAIDWFNYKYPTLRLSKLADALEFTNEGMTGGPAFVRFWNDLMDIAAQHGIHITVTDLAEGNGNADDVHQLLDRMVREGHYLNYHMYSEPDDAGDQSMYPDAQDLELRWVPWVQGHPGLQVVGGEEGTGRAKYLGVPQTVKLWGEFNQMMQPHADMLKGGAFWAYVGPGVDIWRDSDASEALPAYEKMCMEMDSVSGIVTGPVSTVQTGQNAAKVAAATSGLPDATITSIRPETSDNPPEYILTLGDLRIGLNNARETALVAVLATVLNVRSSPDSSSDKNIIGKVAKSTRIIIFVDDDATRAAHNGYVQIAGQVNHWVFYRLLEPVAS